MQWQGLLQNLGTWEGSFLELSSDGSQRQTTPSQLTMSLSADEQTIHFQLKRIPDSGAAQEMALQFHYPGPGAKVPFFEDGCFSQGALQWSKWSQFGTELALVEGNRRLRLVQIYAQDTLSSLTLIQERLADSGAQPSPPLSVSDLMGTWFGEATTLYPDGRQDAPVQTLLSVKQDGDRLQQMLQFDQKTICSTAKIDGSSLQFESGPQPMQLLCLPGGASCLFPTQIQPYPFILEAGWLISPTHRKRLFRSYSATGEWLSITRVVERKV